MRDTLLTVHVLAGTTGLLLGPVWLVARRHGARARPAAVGYQFAVLVVSATGAVLAVITPGLAWLLPVAVLTQALAVTGALARRRRWPRWDTLQPHLLGGSYIALVTALLVAETGNPLFWVLPALVGQAPIAVAKRRLHAAAAVG
ncbi:MAG TPA: hypothetical protein VK402_16725 [Blastococcus sp.]|nr:hypothetical protein [Blastococcus sp.]